MNHRQQTQHMHARPNREKIKREAYFVAVCQICERNYTLGITGTVEGCDHCLGIERNPRDHSIINPGKSMAFAGEDEA